MLLCNEIEPYSEPLVTNPEKQLDCDIVVEALASRVNYTAVVFSQYSGSIAKNLTPIANSDRMLVWSLTQMNLGRSLYRGICTIVVYYTQ